MAELVEGDDSKRQPTSLAFIVLFNLLLGGGVFALPKVLTQGGWVLGPAFLILTAFLSYVAVTFVVEAMTAANALVTLKHQEDNSSAESSMVHDKEDQEIFNVHTKFEYGEMGEIFFGKAGQLLVYGALSVYLYGSTIAFASRASASIVKLIYGEKMLHAPIYAHDLVLCTCACVVVPFCFYEFKSTKFLQYVSFAFKNTAICIVVGMATYKLFQRGPQTKDVPIASLKSLPNLFGTLVYCTMCHYSLPEIISDIQEKGKVMSLPAKVYGSVTAIYAILFLVCAIAFGVAIRNPVAFSFEIAEFGVLLNVLGISPVLGILSSFPILCITLRNNLHTFVEKYRDHVLDHNEPSEYLGGHSPHRHFFLSAVAAVPQFLLAAVGHHVDIPLQTIIGYAGDYSGSAVMFIIPGALALYSRRAVAALIPGGPSRLADSHPRNGNASPFQHAAWVWLLLLWACVVMVVCTYERIRIGTSLLPSDYM